MPAAIASSMMEEYHIEMMEAALSSPEGQAACYPTTRPDQPDHDKHPTTDPTTLTSCQSSGSGGVVGLVGLKETITWTRG
jgi:hypothetical protein